MTFNLNIINTNFKIKNCYIHHCIYIFQSFILIAAEKTEQPLALVLIPTSKSPRTYNGARESVVNVLHRDASSPAPSPTALPVAPIG